MKEWEKDFVNSCQVMALLGQTEKSLPQIGKIIFDIDLQCEKCGQTGLYLGIELEYGAIHEITEAKYCNYCQSIF